ncbi:MAG: DUF1206 domain-containing protein [Nocardioides sp.]
MAGRSPAREMERGAGRSTALDIAVRVGLGAYGFVHLLVAWVTLRLVFGDNSGKATGKGALAQLADDALGQLTLGAIALCFAALVVWQLLAAAVGFRDREGVMRHLMRVGAGARAVTYGYLGVSAARLALEGRSASGGSPDSTTAKLMSAPAGQLLVAGVGLVAASIGIGLVVFGIGKHFLGQLDEEARHQDRRIPIVVVGQAGYVVKGLSFVVIGVLLGWAAYTHDPEKSGGLDAALHELLGRSLGTFAVVVVGVGMAAFGLYLLARSRHLDDDSFTV